MPAPNQTAAPPSVPQHSANRASGIIAEFDALSFNRLDDELSTSQMERAKMNQRRAPNSIRRKPNREIITENSARHRETPIRSLFLKVSKLPKLLRKSSLKGPSQTPTETAARGEMRDLFARLDPDFDSDSNVPVTGTITYIAE